jgi:hypothetical protein
MARRSPGAYDVAADGKVSVVDEKKLPLSVVVDWGGR